MWFSHRWRLKKEDLNVHFEFPATQKWRDKYKITMKNNKRSNKQIRTLPSKHGPWTSKHQFVGLVSSDPTILWKGLKVSQLSNTGDVPEGILAITSEKNEFSTNHSMGNKPQACEATPSNNWIEPVIPEVSWNLGTPKFHHPFSYMAFSHVQITQSPAS